MTRWIILSIFLSIFTVSILSAQDDDLPAGKGKDVLQRMCTTCHGLTQVTEIRSTKKLWENVVEDMVSRGAEASDDEVKTVVSYLSRNFGQPIDVNSATAKDLQDGLSFNAAEAEAVVKYRTDNGKFKTFEDLAKVPGIRADVLEEQKKNIRF
jgi:competence ComEA-like helix-hairpin-helix protein